MRSVCKVPRPARFTARQGLALGVGFLLLQCSALTGTLTSFPITDEEAHVAAPSSLAALSEAIKRHPDDPQAYNRRGSALSRDGRYPEALADFDDAIALNPNYVPAIANRAQV